MPKQSFLTSIIRMELIENVFLSTHNYRGSRPSLLQLETILSFMGSSDPDPDTNQDDGIQSAYAGAKRRIATLEQEIKALQEAGSKKKS